MQAWIANNSPTRLLKGKPHILGPRCSPSAAVTQRTQSFWTRSKSEHESIAGTAPFHNAYIFLHTCLPPPSYPAKVHSALQRTLQRATLRFGGYVNFAWAPEQRVLAPSSSSSGRAEWEEGDEEAYVATAFSRLGGRLEIPEVSARNMGEVVRRLEAHTTQNDNAGMDTSAVRRRDDDVLNLYVCTHGERDCRCAEHGGAVYEALRAEVRRRGLGASVRVAGVGHVGGHKYAANLLVYPYGEWFGNLRAEHVSEVLDAILAVQSSSDGFNPETSAPLVPRFWRGRIGLDKQEQLALLERPPSTPSRDFDASATLQPHVSRQ
ncbi:hypothetical protein EIP86_003756 [Pleurotus ostreatoroseus]|nr:hypothetical protein EIP86_003756 [Pleurotus ostreatoroseus]